MRTLRVELETVTPLLIYGADPRGTPELRPTAFRGALRFWLRAALGGVTDNLDLIKRAEATVFGDSEGGGSVAVRVRPDKSWSSAEKYELLPYRDAPSKRLLTSAFSPGQKFWLTFSQKYNDDVSWASAILSFSLLLLHGGVGRRARRGFGSLKCTGVVVVDPVGSNETEYLAGTAGSAKTKSAYAIREKALSSAKILCESVEPVSLSRSVTFYPALTSHTVYERSEMPFSSWEEAIRESGQAIHNALASNEMGPALTTNITGYATGKSRMASPMWIRVVKSSDDYYLSFTLFREKSMNDQEFSDAEAFLRSFKIDKESAK